MMMSTSFHAFLVAAVAIPHAAAFLVPGSAPVGPKYPSGLHASAPAAEPSLGEVIEWAVTKKYGADNVKRVIKSWRRRRAGELFEREWGEGKGLQQAGSFIEGLTAEPWHDVDAYPWALGLEQNWQTIAMELSEATKMENLAQRGNNVWVSAARDDAAMTYGPDWRTLVLQDRVWDGANTAIFKETTRLIKELGVPSCEVFFARQDAHTGIKPHSDDCNFLLTAHLGLDIPEGQCWIRVGPEKREWRNGGSMVFDSSFHHETDNAADRPRTVLLIRFWHPEVTLVERDALDFMMAALEDPEVLAPVLTPELFIPDRFLPGQERQMTPGAVIIGSAAGAAAGAAGGSAAAGLAAAGGAAAETRQARRAAERERRKQEQRGGRRGGGI